MNGIINLKLNNMNNVVEQMYNQFEELKGLVKAERVMGRFNNSFYYPEQQYLWLDALKADDVSSGIAQNSIYICFKIDFKEQR